MGGCKKTFIIAEIGVNHNGDCRSTLDSIMMQLVQAAEDAEADAIKLQLWGKNQFPSIEHLRITQEQFIQLRNYCYHKKLKCFATAFDIDSIEFLDGLQNIWKIPSGMTINEKYLKNITYTKGEILLSTGLTSLEEIEHALEILREEKRKITLLQCTSDYPARYQDVNLRTMINYRNQFLCEYGLSSHIPDIYDAVAAVALGATVIEKHLTLNREMDGPDHKSSLEPLEFKEMVSAIRKVEQVLGSPFKELSAGEKQNRSKIRKAMQNV